jgi:microcystin-dependent protein
MAYVGDPPGTLKAYAGGSAPAGYLMCDGSAVSRSTYSVLWNTIGTAYGSGDGSTTFNLPDLRGRVPVGVGSHTDVDSLGKNDGSSLADRRVKHKHTSTHNLTAPYPQSTNRSGGEEPTGSLWQGTGSSTGVNGSVSVGPQTNVPTDGPAFVTFNYIIKT